MKPISIFSGIDFDGHSFRSVFEAGAASPRTSLYHMVDNDKGQGVVLYKFDQFCITFNSYYFRKSDKGVYRKGNFKLVYRFTRLFFNENNGPGNGTQAMG